MLRGAACRGAGWGASVGVWVAPDWVAVSGSGCVFQLVGVASDRVGVGGCRLIGWRWVLRVGGGCVGSWCRGRLVWVWGAFLVAHGRGGGCVAHGVGRCRGSCRGVGRGGVGSDGWRVWLVGCSAGVQRVGVSSGWSGWWLVGRWLVWLRQCVGVWCWSVGQVLRAWRACGGV